MTYALPAPSVAMPVGDAKHAPLPTPSKNADRPQPATVATAPAALTARTALPRLSTTRNPPAPSSATPHGPLNAAALGKGAASSAAPAIPVPDSVFKRPDVLRKRTRCAPNSETMKPPEAGSPMIPRGRPTAAPTPTPSPGPHAASAPASVDTTPSRKARTAPPKKGATLPPSSPMSTAPPAPMATLAGSTKRARSASAGATKSAAAAPAGTESAKLAPGTPVSVLVTMPASQ